MIRIIFFFHFKIIGKILVWARNANRVKRWSEPGGIPILTLWHNSVVNYDNAMRANQPVDALGSFYIITECLNLALPYIKNCDCRDWIADTYEGFGAVVHGLGIGTVTMQQANKYMIQVYTTFENQCGACVGTCQ